VRSSMPLVTITVVVAVFGVLLIARARLGRGRSAWARVRSAVSGDLRDGLLARRAWPVIALTSVLVVCGHAVTFLIAARAAGITAPTSQVVPLALLVMLAIALPSVGGWGPREGAAAWAFGAAGLGAEQGVATAVAFGIMVLVASMPGAVLLVVSWFRRIQSPEQAEPPLPEQAAHA
jgi:glycosyltransferase 2 family protein